jgi:hypothetical protein
MTSVSPVQVKNWEQPLERDVSRVAPKDPGSVVALPAEVDSVILNVTIPKQGQDNWCWAAVAIGIDAAYGENTRTQCSVASAITGIECCPGNSQPGRVGACDEPRALPRALDKHFREELTDATHPGHKNPAFVKGEIDVGHPVAVRLASAGSQAGHFVVIAGYSVAAGGALNVRVWDPATGSASDERFEEFRINFKQFGEWERTFTTRGDPAVGRFAGTSRRKP